MALISCSECDKMISEEAKTCPGCGVSVPGNGRIEKSGCLKPLIMGFMLMIFSIILIAVFIGLAMSS